MAFKSKIPMLLASTWASMMVTLPDRLSFTVTYT
jgi:hypothetical protein